MFTDPKKNVEKMELLPGMQVADLGCGAGTYTLLAARMVGENGKVYAVDIQKELLATLKKEAHESGLSNIEVIWGDVEKLGGTRLADSSLDFIVASNILFQVEDKQAFVKESFRLLKPDKGRICVLDWQDSFGGLGPRTEDVVNSEKAKEIFAQNGFSLDKELINVGAHHYGLTFRKQK